MNSMTSLVEHSVAYSITNKCTVDSGNSKLGFVTNFVY